MIEYAIVGILLVALVAALFFIIESFLMTRYVVRLRHWQVTGGFLGERPMYPFLLSDLLTNNLGRWRHDREQESK